MTQLANQGKVLSGTAGQDSLFGGDGNDVINGLGGNDMLLGNGGDDTYVFGVGSGHDTVMDQHGMSTVQMTAGVSAADLTLNRDANNNLVLSLVGSAGGASGADTLTFDRWYQDTSFQNAQVTFADGTVWNLPRMAENVPVMGTNGDDDLSGSNSQDIFDGLGGSDTLNGGAGNDTYIFGIGSGHDTVQDAGGYDRHENRIPGGFDTVQMKAGVAAANVRMSRDGDDNLVLMLAGGDDSLTLTHWFGSAATQVEQVSFADGMVWNLTQLASTIAPQGYATALRGDQGDLRVTYYDAYDNLLSASSFAGGGQGAVNAANYDAAGHLLGYSAYFDDGKGNTSTTQLDTNHVKLSGTWTKVDDTHGNDTLNVDGTSSGKTFDADSSGSYSSYANDGQGRITTRYYPGLYYDFAWYSHFIGDAHGNGTTTNYEKDGIEIGYSTRVNDGLGNSSTTNFDPSGVKLSVNWTKADGSSGGDDFGFFDYYVSNTDDGHGNTSSISHYADGSYITALSDSKGNITRVSFDASGVKRSDDWRKADGSDGDDIFQADGSSTGRIFNADGSESRYSKGVSRILCKRRLS